MQIEPNTYPHFTRLSNAVLKLTCVGLDADGKVHRGGKWAFESWKDALILCNNDKIKVTKPGTKDNPECYTGSLEVRSLSPGEVVTGAIGLTTRVDLYDGLGMRYYEIRATVAFYPPNTVASVTFAEE